MDSSKAACAELPGCPLAIGPVKQTCCLLKEQWLLDSTVLTAINPRDIFAQPPPKANGMAEQERNRTVLCSELEQGGAVDSPRASPGRPGTLATLGNANGRAIKTLFQDGGSVVKHLPYWFKNLSLDA